MSLEAENRIIELENEVAELKEKIYYLEKNEHLNKEINKYTHLFTNHSAIFLLINASNGKIVNANKAAEKFYGYPSGQLRAMYITDLNSLSKEEVLKELNSARNLEKNIFYFKHKLSNGDIRNVEVFSIPVQISGNEYLFSIIHDITEKVTTEIHINKLNALYQMILDNTNVWITARDFKGDFILWNSGAELISGYSREEVIGHKKVLEWVYPDIEYRNYVGKLATEVYEGKSKSNLQLKICCKSGEYRTISMFSKKIISKTGELEGIINIAFDLTDKLNSEKALRESEERYKLLFQNSPLGIFHFDKDSNLIDCNHIFVEIIGSSYERLLKLKLLRDLKDEKLKEEIRKTLNGQSGYYEDSYNSVTANKSSIVRVILNKMTLDTGEIIGGIGIVEDITIRKNIEKELEEQTNKLNTTLNAIKSDLKIARQIQEKILPDKRIAIPGIDYDFIYSPLEEIGGDVFDIVDLGNGTIRIFLADAIGHGIQAALITIAIRSEYENLKSKYSSPAQLLEALNQSFLKKYNSLNTFFPCIVIDIHLSAHYIDYASAGFLEQILLKENGIFYLEHTGSVIGLKDNYSIIEQQLPIQNGDFLLVYSDGLSETLNQCRDFGDENIIALLLQRLKGNCPKDIVTGIFNKIDECPKIHNLSDDVTIIGIQICI